jgi:hypothetical protein
VKEKQIGCRSLLFRRDAVPSILKGLLHSLCVPTTAFVVNEIVQGTHGHETTTLQSFASTSLTDGTHFAIRFRVGEVPGWNNSK